MIIIQPVYKHEYCRVWRNVIKASYIFGKSFQLYIFAMSAFKKFKLLNIYIWKSIKQGLVTIQNIFIYHQGV